MERYTYQENGKWRMCIGDTEYSGKAVDRLAAYEDTGLEPEEIRILQKRYESFRGATSDVTGQPIVDFDRLRELARADREGRCVVLPCQPGDHIWIDGRKAIIEEFFGYETERYFHAQFYDNMQYIDVPFGDIGKTVFLTRKEAEAALEGIKND